MRVRWLHVETGGDPQLPTHGPKVFVARAVNTPTKYSHHIGNLAGLPLAFSDRTFTFLTGSRAITLIAANWIWRRTSTRVCCA
jgi:hypothetical protein